MLQRFSSSALFIMQKLIWSVNKLKKTPIKKTIDSRILSFKALGKKNGDEIFKELCFCIMTANFSADRGIEIQKKIGKGFLSARGPAMAKKLKACGHRFPNTRAKYIIEARRHKKALVENLKALKNDENLRQWIADNIKGLGLKESSHFLRNIGRDNCAIIDFHIVDILAEHGLINEPKTLTKKTYLEIELVLKKLADKLELTLAELDLYLWYLETGKVLK
ncbi:MAG: N-glycosylase/DNA lyase [Candidatus Margulisiibacteriota bacterium]